MEQVTRRSAFAIGRFALALAATLAIAAVALGVFLALHRPPQRIEARATPPAPRLAAPLAPASAITLPAKETTAAAAETPARLPAPRRHRHRMAHPQPMLAANAAGDAKPAMTLQLQTSNPNIRIIWIERSSK